MTSPPVPRSAVPPAAVPPAAPNVAPAAPSLLDRLPPRLLQPALRVTAALNAAGGEVWLVGGAVRDTLLGFDVNDVDLEVHNLSATATAAALRRVGAVKAVGRSFGVFKLRLGAETLDICLPRAEGAATQDAVEVVGDPFIGIEAALRRRDLSVNAMAIRLPDGALCDPTGGAADLAAGLLRPADPAAFGDDPLRVLRAARFGARFGFALSPSLPAIAARLPLEALPPARVWGELRLILLGPRPAHGLQLLDELGVLDRLLPELAAQPRPALLATAARLPALRAALPAEGEALAAALAALLPPGAAEGAERLLDRLDLHSWAGAPLRAQTLAAVALLGAPAADWADAATDTTLRRAAERLSLDLGLRAGLAQQGAPVWQERIDRAAALGALRGPLPPLLTGRALIRLGVAPGTAMGQALAELRDAQLSGAVTTEDQARDWVSARWPAAPAG